MNPLKSKPTLTLKRKAQEPASTSPSTLLHVKPALDGPPVNPELPPQHRGKTKCVRTSALTAAQREIVERILTAAGAEETEPHTYSLRLMQAAANDVHAGAWPSNRVVFALQLAGHGPAARALRHSLSGLRMSRFADVAALSVEVIRRKHASTVAKSEVQP